MTTVEAPVRLGICLDIACKHADSSLYHQMSSGKYDECATMPLPRNVEAWEAEHRTARKRAWKAQAHGYRFDRIAKRDGYKRDVHAINTSRDMRQGRYMTTVYREVPEFHDDPYPCELHGVHFYGIFQNVRLGIQEWKERLVAYLWMYRAGDLALVSQVLGHADHEPNGIMYLLFREALAAEGAIAPGVCVYNRWDSGTDGLRFLKARIGFEPTAVEWLP